MVSTERAKVEFDLFLVLIVPLLMLGTKILPKLALFISSMFFRRSEKEADQLAAAREIRMQMREINMTDEFAKYAKLQRKLNQLTLELESSGDCRKALQTKVYRWVLGVLSFLLGISYFALLFSVGTWTPVFVVPKHWFFPIQWILAYPTGVEGAISIPVWTVLTRTVIAAFVKGK